MCPILMLNLGVTVLCVNLFIQRRELSIRQQLNLKLGSIHVYNRQ